VTNKQLAALYVELLSLYEEDFPQAAEASSDEQQMLFINKILAGKISAKDIQLIEPVFSYGHVDIHRYIQPKKRFIWF